jgi:hypothetical protein
MARRAPKDFPLKFLTVQVKFLGGSVTVARAEGNNATWICECKDPVPLMGRCYYQFGDTCYSVCPNCSRKFRVNGDQKKRATGVSEF